MIYLEYLIKHHNEISLTIFELRTTICSQNYLTKYGSLIIRYLEKKKDYLQLIKPYFIQNIQIQQ